MQAPDFVGTPARVASLWSRYFLAGHAMDPADILGETVGGEGETSLVVVRNLPFSGMCPHHLMPFVGSATVAYLPGEQLVGFGRLSDLVRCMTARLTLQERACNNIVDAIMTHLDARGAGCMLVGEHMCLRVPDHQHHAEVVSAAFRGALNEEPALRETVLARSRP